MDDIDRHSIEELERVRATISLDEVNHQVEWICRSKTFESQRNSQKLLRYLVGKSIEGNPPSPEEIAKYGLGKENFDPGDSQVRKEMEKLRKRLTEYNEEEAKVDEIWLYIPARQYTVFWRHSPKSHLGATEFGGWVLWASKLPSEAARQAALTSQRFWPQLSTAFPVYCTESFRSEIRDGKIELPEQIQLFFNSIGNYHVYITTLDCSEIRIYPLHVWLAEWARLKSSEDSDHVDASTYELWGKGSEIENKTSITLHSRLLNAVDIPPGRNAFGISLCFHPDGFLYFVLPEPRPRPAGKCKLYLLFNAPDGENKFYYYLLISLDKEQAFLDVLNGTKQFNIKNYAYVVASGSGDPPSDLKAQLLEKYDAILED